MAHYRVEREEEEGGGGNFGWFLAGVIIGAVGAVLFAPGPGQQTRTAVTETGRDVLERSREVYQKGCQMVDDAAELFERGRKLVREG